MKKFILLSAIALMSCSKQTNPFKSDLHGDVLLKTEYLTSRGDTLIITRTFFENGLVVQQTKEIIGSYERDERVFDFKYVSTDEGYEMYANGQLWAITSPSGDKKQWFFGEETIQRTTVKLTDDLFYTYKSQSPGSNFQEVDTTGHTENYNWVKHNTIHNSYEGQYETWQTDTTYIKERDKYDNVTKTQTDIYTSFIEYDYE